MFVAPYILFQDEFYVGGQQYNRYGGVKTDFGYKNIETGNCAIIEIKDAKTPLITKYRNTDEFCISNFLAGGISQILKQKDTLYKDYWNVTRNDPRFNVNNIKSILVIGKMPDDDDQRVAFESFRNELNSVEVITFDELLGKIELQIQIIEGTLFQNGSDLWDN